MSLKRTNKRSWSRAVWLLAAVFHGVTARGASESDFGADYFEKHVRPLLTAHCLDCHSGRDPKGGLSLAWRGGWASGGSRGPALVPGYPEQSLLIQMVNHRHPELQMPKGRPQLSPADRDALREWVRMGAYDPRKSETGASRPAVDSRAAAGHWAFQMVQRPGLPCVDAVEWCQTAVDRFVLRRLAREGLSPSAPADPRAWLRRVHLDLLGVPPTPESVEAFNADPSLRARHVWVEKLLADPRYGERWGRHWLDVARYADTAGYRAVGLQRRFPYSYTYRDYVVDAFNRDHPFDRFVREQIAADLLPGGDRRSLAALGLLTIGRSFLDDPFLEVDDRIDVVTRGFLGLTVQCARCHDHKYDPIPTADYYSLYGVFASVKAADPAPNLGDGPPAAWHSEYLAERDRRERVYADRLAEEVEKAQHRIRSAGGSYLFGLQQHGDGDPTPRFLRERKLNPVVFRQLREYLRKSGSWRHPVLGPWRAMAAGDSGDGDGRPLWNMVIANELKRRRPASLKDLADVYNRVFAECDQPEVFADLAREEVRLFLRSKDSPYTVPEAEHWNLVQLVREPLNELRAAIAELDAEHRGAPARAMSVVERRKPVDPVIFVRGNPRNRGESVPRRMLELIAGKERTAFRENSGRLAVAESLVSRSNPLTARVLVNRLWRHHFGAALVDSMNDFGLRAAPPTHPELLDWLAAEFMESGWSIKHIHRLILLSASYGQSSRVRVDAAAVDPGNQLLWRMNRRRLDLEAMRDTMLEVAGQLDYRQGGQAGDILGPEFARRRSLYAFVDRSEMSAFHRAFDLANPDVPVGERAETSVPQQALFLMNSGFTRDLAAAVVNEPRFVHAASSEDRVIWLWRRFFQREPSVQEQSEAGEFLRGHDTGPAYHGPIGWQYGVGIWHEEDGRVSGFTAFNSFTNGVRRFSDGRWPKAWLDERGGHPPDGAGSVVVRRWIAPASGEVRLLGQLSHRSTVGDGLVGVAVSDRQGVLGRWEVRQGALQAVWGGKTVRVGERLDFLCAPGPTSEGDDFIWIPRLEYVSYANPRDARRAKPVWGAKADFDRSFDPIPRRMSRWEQYVQVLLEANELHFID